MKCCTQKLLASQKSLYNIHIEHSVPGFVYQRPPPPPSATRTTIQPGGGVKNRGTAALGLTVASHAFKPVGRLNTHSHWSKARSPPPPRPVYTYDTRGKGDQGARHWSNSSALGGRGFFRGSDVPGVLVLDSVLAGDAGLYTCRVDFYRAPTQISRVLLNVIGRLNFFSAQG